MQPDLEPPSVSAPTTATATDYSQNSLSLSHSQGTAPSYAHENDFDFNGSHIAIAGAFEPAINLSAYDGFSSQGNGLDGVHPLSGLDGDGFAGLGLAVNSNNELVALGGDVDVGATDNMGCYPTKPNWHHANLIAMLENAAETYPPYLGHETHHSSQGGHEVMQSHRGYHDVSHADDLVAQGLHDPQVNVNAGLWNLQSPFHEDTGSGAVVNTLGDGRSKSHGVGMGLGVGVLDMIERDQRARGY